MKNSKSLFLRWTAVLLALAVTIFSLLLGMQINKAEPTGMNVPPQPRHVTTFDSPRPEIGIEQLLNLDEANGFDPNLTSLKWKRERQREALNQPTPAYEQVASVSHDQKGVHEQ